MRNLSRLLNKRSYSNSNQSISLNYPISQYPSQLRYDRELQTTILDNGMKVCTEYWPSQLATAALFINCGSRSETLETSGTAHFLEHMHFKGTQNRTRTRLELDVENMGGQLNAYTSRENTSYTMTVFKDNLRSAVEILSDMMLNSVYNKNELEIERDTIYRELLETQKEFMETLVEYAHGTSYQQHMMGQPILGQIYNMRNITQDMVIEYHSNNYYGKNMLIVGVGEINHDQFVQQCNDYFGKLKTLPNNQQEKQIHEKPEYNRLLQFKTADLLEEQPEGINLGVFYEAPCWTDDDYFAFLLLQRILADKPDHALEAALYATSSINRFQTLLTNQFEIQEQKTIYTPYADTGMFGTYFYGNVDGFQNMIALTKQQFKKLGEFVDQNELQRAKNKLYIELFQHETQNDISQAIGNQILYFNRRVPRTEIAQRVASYTPEEIQNVCKKWFSDDNFSVTAWGNVEELQQKYQRKVQN